ncbi:hypothetical protein [Pedobacter sp. B4-66]|uniref:hypothetical protein n=1 Tax=Pedobacter sp. B4-66 TaxID=2817280 RepID=UPI001BDA97FF|nr:hypothetical protein [Pedobacter sp. B4-66]
MEKTYIPGITAKITIPTSDCIKKYCEMKSLGVNFIKAPAYSHRGLSADFIDAFGNECSILEERNYQSSYAFCDEIR